MSIKLLIELMEKLNMFLGLPIVQIVVCVSAVLVMLLLVAKESSPLFDELDKLAAESEMWEEMKKRSEERKRRADVC